MNCLFEFPYIAITISHAILDDGAFDIRTFENK